MLKEFALSCPLMGKKSYWFLPKNSELLITQYFGENAVDFYKTLGLLGHNGIDFGVRHIKSPSKNGGTAKSIAYAPVLAPISGTIISDTSIQSDTKGRYVEIMSDPVLIGVKECKVKITLFHLANVEDRATYGKRIRAGAVVGYGGNTGEFTTGAHLHFGIYPYWKQDNGTYQRDWNNGYNGAIDPLPYFTNCRSVMSGDGKYYYKGKEISKTQRNLILNS